MKNLTIVNLLTIICVIFLLSSCGKKQISNDLYNIEIVGGGDDNNCGSYIKFLNDTELEISITHPGQKTYTMIAVYEYGKKYGDEYGKYQDINVKLNNEIYIEINDGNYYAGDAYSGYREKWQKEFIIVYTWDNCIGMGGPNEICGVDNFRIKKGRYTHNVNRSSSFKLNDPYYRTKIKCVQRLTSRQILQQAY